MPLSRRKSCLPCSQAKLRCNRGKPSCSRCASKKQRCDYQQDGPAAPMSTPSMVWNTHASSFFSVETPPVTVPDTLQDLTNVDDLDLPDPGFLFGVDWTDVNGQATYSKEIPPGTSGMNDLDHALSSKNNAPAFSLSSGSFDLITPALLSQDDAGAGALQSMGMDFSPASMLGSTSQVLSSRPCTQGKILESVILGQLMSFPKMMIEGDRLPPFIHPLCYRDGRLAPACAEQSFHQCLPEELAVCQSLVRSFYSRTRGNADFVWGQIYAESKRISQEVLALILSIFDLSDVAQHRHFDLEGRLRALQSMVVYLILQAEDADTIERNDSIGLLKTVIHVAVSVVRSGREWRMDFPPGVPSQMDWLQRESIRRTIGVLHVILRLVYKTHMPTCPAPDLDHRLVAHPLPCHRDIWEARSLGIWMEVYRKYSRSRRSTRVLVVGDVMVADQTSKGGAQRADVVKWCENMDAVGTLLWMLIPLEGSQVSPDRLGNS